MKNDALILIVDDEPDIRNVLRILLTANGYEILEASTGQQAISSLLDHPEIDLILLDIMMPGMSGLEACQKIREFSTAPILFLTAKTQTSDKLSAYNNGGDDYLGKPFSQDELLMKVSSLLRRYRIYQGKPENFPQSQAAVPVLAVDGHTVKKRGVPVELTVKEVDIVRYLLEHQGSAVSAEKIYQDVWHEKYMPSSGNTVMVHMLNLRKKLEDDPTNPTIIRTIWGKGYQIDG